MLLLFWCVQFMHWYAVYSLGIHFTETNTIYSVIIFASAVIVIAAMLCVGSNVNSKKATHEYYQLKISEARIKMKELEKREMELEKALARKKAEEEEAAYGMAYAGYNPSVNFGASAAGGYATGRSNYDTDR